jgi:hypothetical protein
MEQLTVNANMLDIVSVASIPVRKARLASRRATQHTVATIAGTRIATGLILCVCASTFHKKSVKKTLAKLYPISKRQFNVIICLCRWSTVPFMFMYCSLAWFTQWSRRLSERMAAAVA